MYGNKIELLQLIKRFEAIIQEFAVAEKGVFLSYTDDSIVVKILRNMFSTHLQLKGDFFRCASRDEELLKEAKRIHEAKGKALFFIERIVNNQNSIQLIKFLKTTYPGSLIMLLTRETEQDVLIYLHECGADSFVVKPVSVNTMIEKVALTIQPQGQLPKLVNQGKDFIQQKRYAKALEIVDKILAIKPNSPAALMIKGDALKCMGRNEAALQAYMQAADHAQLYLEPLKKIVAFFKETNDIDSQLQYLEKLERLSPLNVERKVEIGGIHLHQGRSEQAETYFQDAIKITTRQAREMVDGIKLAVAEACLQNNPKLAERYFREIVDTKATLTSADVHVFNRLGIALRKQGNWEQAIREFKKVLNVARATDIIHYNIGMAYMEGKRYRDAQDAFQRALHINRDELLSNDVVAFNIGLAMQHMKKNDEARALFLRVKELNPDFPAIDKHLNDVG
jgi:tetratricopeptide (TPR) repeat protein